MQLDRTHIKVRVRSLSEIGDLALVMIRQYPQAIFGAFFIGAMPWIIFNALLLYWIPIREAGYGLDDDEANAELLRYAWWMALLIFLQSPAAGVVTTLYLGQAVFEEKPTVLGALGEARRQFWRWFPYLALYRLPVPAMILAALFWGQDANAGVDIFLAGIIFIAALLLRGARPFLPEMILLERCPIRGKDDNKIHLGRRSKALHGPGGGDVGSRFIAVGLMLMLIVASLIYSMVWVRGVITNDWNLGLITLILFYPLALWIVAGIAVLVRLLTYLDTRIRFEGWDVELALRAEMMRQFGEDSALLRMDEPKTVDTGKIPTAIPTAAPVTGQGVAQQMTSTNAASKPPLTPGGGS